MDILPDINAAVDPDLISPLILAYIGDAVFELMVRNRAISEFTADGKICVPVGMLHKYSTSHVKAKSQADSIQRILEVLTPEEQDVYRRGRNANPSTMAKHAEVGDYRQATGFEALMGYLFLKGDHDRLRYIFELTMKG